MRLYGVRLFVDDLPAARAFYEQALGLVALWDDPALEAVVYGLGDAAVIVEKVVEDGSHDGLVGRFAGVSFAVPDIAVAYRALVDKGVVFSAPPKPQPWGGLLANFKDPAGNTLTLIEEPSSAAPGA